jgi:hypothetical protein
MLTDVIILTILYVSEMLFHKAYVDPQEVMLPLFSAQRAYITV